MFALTSSASAAPVGLVHLDLLSVDGGSVELGDAAVGLAGVAHGDEGVSLVGDVDVVDAAVLAEGLLQHLARAVAVDAVHEQLGGLLLGGALHGLRGLAQGGELRKRRRRAGGGPGGSESEGEVSGRGGTGGRVGVERGRGFGVRGHAGMRLARTAAAVIATVIYKKRHGSTIAFWVWQNKCVLYSNKTCTYDKTVGDISFH